MATKEQAKEWQRVDDEVRKNLPPGVKLLRTLRGHTNGIGRIAWSPDGRRLASPSEDKTIRLWDVETGKWLRTLEGHTGAVYSVAFDPTGGTLASGSADNTVKLWDAASGRLLRTLEGHQERVFSVAFDPAGRKVASGGEDNKVKLWEAAGGRLLHTLYGHQSPVLSVAFDRAGWQVASGSGDKTVKLWEAASGRLLQTLKGHTSNVFSVLFDPQANGVLASGCWDKTVNLWDLNTGRLIRTLEGHTAGVGCVAYLPAGGIIASKGSDDTIRLWHSSTGASLAIIPEPAGYLGAPGLAFHPHRPLLAIVGSDPATPRDHCDHVIHIYELDFDVLLGQPAKPSVSYTSAKVVLVGDSGVGKTGLGWRLAHGEFKEHASTHGQQFWLLEQLSKKRQDGTECEAVLWDLAGQPDYRLIHALFLDDADLALVLFDPTRNDDPLAGVEFWLKQLKVGHPAGGGPPTVLIAARSDRGTPRLTKEELDAFCRQRGIVAYLPTSAMAGDGIEALLERMKGLIPWDAKAATVTTKTFKRIKDYVLALKEAVDRRKMILTPEELRERLEATDHAWQFTDAEMLTAVGHLENHGYLTRLRTSQGEPRILLAPELLNNLAASFVLEARRNEKGLGSLEEQKLLEGGYRFPELEKVKEAERAILLDSAAALFLEHNVCFRESDLFGAAYLVFPELINLKRPSDDDGKPLEDGVAYMATGAVENVYASLVVLMGYTQTFTRTNQWRNHARYEVGRGQVCGFRLEAERAGELDFVLYFGPDAPAPVRMLFQSLFENFLLRRNLTVRRFEPVACKNGHPLNRAVVRELLSLGAESTFCNRCGEKTTLPKADQPIQLTSRQADEVEANRRAADERSHFEQVLFRLKTYVTEQKLPVPECFISYAWGNSDHELWVERRLATDLRKAGVTIVLDRWENARIGESVSRFVERVEKTNLVIVVGTQLYRKKYDSAELMGGFGVGAEADLIGNRMIDAEGRKQSVLPVLLEGSSESAFPSLLHGRVYADFRDPEDYFATILALILSIHSIPPQSLVALELQKRFPPSARSHASPSEDEFDRLANDALNDEDARKRESAIRKLASNKGNAISETFDVFLSAAREDDVDYVRCSGLEGITQLFHNDTRTLPVLKHALSFDLSSKVRTSCVVILAAKWSHHSDIQHLLEERAIQDPDETVRQAVLREFLRKWRHSSSTLRVLNAVSKNVTSPRLSESAANDLKLVRIDRSKKWLRWLNGDEKIRAFSKLPEVEKGFPCIRVLAVQLKNIGPFKDTGEVWFTKSQSGCANTVTLLLGDNAAGKSTLLRAIAFALMGTDLAFRADSEPDHSLHCGTQNGSIDVLCELRLDSIDVETPQQSFRLAIGIQKGQRKFHHLMEPHPNFGAKNAVARLDWLRDKKSVDFGFMCGYGALRNLTVINESQTEFPDDIFGRVRSLFRSNASLLDPDLLHRLLKGAAIPLSRDSGPMKLPQDTRAKVMERLASLLPSLSEAGAAESMALSLHGIPLPLHELSEGYLSLLAIVGHLYCHSLSARKEVHLPCDIWGLMLIDEIDLHLHPTWQRTVLPDLEKVFPNLQIIATTHSPIVAGSVAPASTLVIKREEAESRIISDLPPVEGFRADQILTSSLFGLSTSRNIATQELHQQYANLLAEKGPEDDNVKELGRRVASLLAYHSEGTVDAITHKAITEFIHQRFGNLDTDTQNLVIAQAGLRLSD